MSPDDPRHGTNAGCVAHWKARETPCLPCADANRSYAKRRKYERHQGKPRLVPAIGYQRRIRALHTLGYSFSWIADQLNATPSTLSNRVYRSEWVSRTNMLVLVELYERVCMTPNPTPDLRTIHNARRKGFAPPLAWDDIDDPTERPAVGTNHRRRDDIDHAVVERFLCGEHSLKTTPAERRQITHRWPGSLADLERITGWATWRYVTREDGAA